ncbi:MAG: hypothetical protein GXP16_07050, partial [Gammaproteobacteria bacterium]|nr:hypothetical protein [Gammaproteobacteria bacterium]
VVLPEMFSTGFTMASTEVAENMTGATVAWLQNCAVQQGRVLCGSMVVVEQGRYYNRFLWIDANGTISIYDKRHRFRMAGENQHYSAGDARVVINFEGWRLCPMICYDLRFPVWFRNRNDYDAIICVANWPAARQNAWNDLLKARAIENQAYVAAVNIIGTDGNEVNYGGGSAGYGPDGSVLVEYFDTEQIVNVHFQSDKLLELRKLFPVWQDADDFELEKK